MIVASCPFQCDCRKADSWLVCCVAAFVLSNAFKGIVLSRTLSSVSAPASHRFGLWTLSQKTINISTRGTRLYSGKSILLVTRKVGAVVDLTYDVLTAAGIDQLCGKYPPGTEYLLRQGLTAIALPSYIRCSQNNAVAHLWRLRLFVLFILVEYSSDLNLLRTGSWSPMVNRSRAKVQASSSLWSYPGDPERRP